MKDKGLAHQARQVLCCIAPRLIPLKTRGPSASKRPTNKTAPTASGDASSGGAASGGSLSPESGRSLGGPLDLEVISRVAAKRKAGDVLTLAEEAQYDEQKTMIDVIADYERGPVRSVALGLGSTFYEYNELVIQCVAKRARTRACTRPCCSAADRVPPARPSGMATW